MSVVDIHTRPICCQLHGNPHSRIRIGKAWPAMTVSRPHQILVIDATRGLPPDRHAPFQDRLHRVRSLRTHGTVARKVIGA